MGALEIDFKFHRNFENTVKIMGKISFWLNLKLFKFVFSGSFEKFSLVSLRITRSVYAFFFHIFIDNHIK